LVSYEFLPTHGRLCLRAAVVGKVHENYNMPDAYARRFERLSEMLNLTKFMFQIFDVCTGICVYQNEASRTYYTQCVRTNPSHWLYVFLLLRCLPPECVQRNCACRHSFAASRYNRYLFLVGVQVPIDEASLGRWAE
jgi:hypothetical protein